MRRRRRVIIIAVAVVVLTAGGGAGVWWRFLRPEPPKPVQEQTYEEIKRADYEQWMKDLGYTE